MTTSVAVYMPDFASGGVQRMHLNLAPRFRAAGYDIRFVVHEAKGALVDLVPPEFPVTSLGAKRALDAVRPLTRYLRETRPDIVVANMGHPNMIALLANRLAGSPSRIIASQRNHLTHQAAEETSWQHKVLPFLYKRFLRHAAGVIAVSEGVADDLAHVTGLPRDRFTVIYNPAVPEDIAARAAEPAEHPWLADGGRTVIAIGRLVPMKDYPTMLRAIAHVPEARLLVLGEGPLLGELSALAAELGIGERVDFAGFRANPYAHLARASCFVLSSRYEGFGNVVAEALACGTPVVTTDCESGPGEIVGGGAFGRLVPVGDDHALGEAIAATLRDPPDAARLRERGQLFSVERAAERYVALFEAVLATRPATAASSSS
jgi:glycosyltransferase involved in cell wall biosynthesis